MTPRRRTVALGTLSVLVALAAAVGTVAALDRLGESLADDAVTDVAEALAEPGLGTTPDGTGRVLDADTTFSLLDGGQATFGDYRGTPLVLNFFASWCQPCTEEMPALDSASAALGGQVRFLGLNYREQVDDGRRIVEETQVGYDIGRDPSGSIFTALEGLSLPTTFLVDADGVIVATASSQALTVDELLALVADELGVAP